MQQFVGHEQRQVPYFQCGGIRCESHTQRPILAHRTVQLALSALGIGPKVNLQKCEILFGIQKRFRNVAVWLEKFAQIIFGNVICQIANIQTISARELNLLMVNGRDIVAGPLQLLQPLANQKLIGLAQAIVESALAIVATAIVVAVTAAIITLIAIASTVVALVAVTATVTSTVTTAIATIVVPVAATFVIELQIGGEKTTKIIPVNMSKSVIMSQRPSKV